MHRQREPTRNKPASCIAIAITCIARFKALLGIRTRYRTVPRSIWREEANDLANFQPRKSWRTFKRDLNIYIYILNSVQFIYIYTIRDTSINANLIYSEFIKNLNYDFITNTFAFSSTTKLETCNHRLRINLSLSLENLSSGKSPINPRSRRKRSFSSRLLVTRSRPVDVALSRLAESPRRNEIIPGSRRSANYDGGYRYRPTLYHHHHRRRHLPTR